MKVKIKRFCLVIWLHVTKWAKKYVTWSVEALNPNDHTTKFGAYKFCGSASETFVMYVVTWSDHVIKDHIILWVEASIPKSTRYQVCDL